MKVYHCNHGDGSYIVVYTSDTCPLCELVAELDTARKANKDQQKLIEELGEIVDQLQMRLPGRKP